MSFLIVEDDRTTRRVLELFLSPHGTVETVSSAGEGLARFREKVSSGRPYQLICLDIGLPDQLGTDVLKTIREVEKELAVPIPVPVLMLTGNADDALVKTAAALGAVGYLLKPVIESELTGYLKKLRLAS